ncbi:MAG: hypothetical protein N3E51_03080 [Candidatus Micrarchaeota archaeon]|nr:hypothetical protein [Candidatus Micrarchaeota archaeon]
MPQPFLPQKTAQEENETPLGRLASFLEQLADELRDWKGADSSSAFLLSYAKTRLENFLAELKQNPQMADQKENLAEAEKIAKEVCDYLGDLQKVPGNLDIGSAIDYLKKKAKEAKDKNEESKEALTFEWLKQNANYTNIQRYIDFKEKNGESYSQEELDFLKFYLVGNVAVEEKLKYGLNEKEKNSMYEYLGIFLGNGGDSSYLTSVYGTYKKGSNDCYTFANIKVFEKYENLYEGKNYSLDGTRVNSPRGFNEGYSRLRSSTGSNFYSFSKFSNLTLQVGDVIGVDKSPNGTGNNHWGILAIINGKPVVIGRGSRLEIWTLEEFFRYATGVDIIRYGSAPYGEYIQYNVRTRTTEIKNGTLPEDSFIH